MCRRQHGGDSCGEIIRRIRINCPGSHTDAITGGTGRRCRHQDAQARSSPIGHRAETASDDAVNVRRSSNGAGGGDEIDEGRERIGERNVRGRIGAGIGYVNGVGDITTDADGGPGAGEAKIQVSQAVHATADRRSRRGDSQTPSPTQAAGVAGRIIVHV